MCVIVHTHVYYISMRNYHNICILWSPKQNTIKFAIYLAEQTHELQNNSVQMWGEKIAEVSFGLDTLRAFLPLLSQYNEIYARLLVDLSNQFHNDKKSLGDNT